MKKKIIICLILIVVIVIGVLAFCFSNNLKDSSNEKLEYNKNSLVIKDSMFKGLSITNLKLKVENGISTFKGIVTNNTDSDISLSDFEVVFKDNAGNVVETMIIYLGETPLRPCESRKFSSKLQMELNSKVAYSAEFRERSGH